MIKKLLTFMALSPMMALGAVSITSVVAEQHADEKVYVEVTLSGSADEVAKSKFMFTATDIAAKKPMLVSNIVQNGEDEGTDTTWIRHYVWNVGGDVGVVDIADVELTVAIEFTRPVDKPNAVQLWEGGPYWATCNVGANEPEEVGYYFWWGDTVGYIRNENNDGWVSVKDGTPFSFEESNCSTYGKLNPQLKAEGYIDSNDNLVAEYDAATAHLGAPWRMPRSEEIEALIRYCDSEWTARDGVYGRLITGKGDYSSHSIFLPAFSDVKGSSCYVMGVLAYYRSSTSHSGYYPLAGYFYGGYGLYFSSSSLSDEGMSAGYYGQQVRPVQDLELETLWADKATSSLSIQTHLTPDGGPYTETVDGIKWTFTVSNGEATVTGADISVSTSGIVVIPPYLGSCSVTSIGEKAFYRCSSLISITIPDSITSICPNAFLECFSLKTVNFSDISKWCSFTRDGSRANPCCYGASLYINGEIVKDLAIPESVQEISEFAFYGCGSLSSVAIPDNITIDAFDYVFGECESLTSFVVSENHPSYTVRNGLLCSKDGKTVIHGVSGNVVIPEGVTSIGSDAFRACKASSVTIPSSVTSIGDWAFARCTSLTSFSIPDNVTSIGDGAFSYCTSLTSITIPDSVTSIERCAFEGCTSLTSITIPDSVTSIGEDAFEYCQSLASITIPNSVTSIGKHAFAHCTSLTSITLPDSVTEIDDYVFDMCSSLTSITIPDSLTSIGDNAFRFCDSLNEVHINDLEAWLAISFESYSSNPCYYAHHLYLNDREITELIIPEGVTSIGSRAFVGCSSLTSVTIPDGVTSIGSSAFDYCSSLKEVHIKDLARWCGIYFGGYTSNPCYYAHHLYLNDREITELIIPEGVTSIGSYAFLGCSSLTSATIPSSVASIGSDAFESCTSLTSITISDGVTSIGEYAFYRCSSLISITIPSSVISLGKGSSIFSPYTYTFAGCSSLTTVYVATGDADRVKELMRNIGVNVDTLTFCVNPDLIPNATYSHDFNGGMTTPSSTLGGVIIPIRADGYGSFVHVIREGEPNGAGAIPSTASGKNGQYGSTELVDDEADWTIAMVAKAANIANGTFWSVGSNCYINGQTGMALVLKDATHVSLVRWQKGGSGNETLLTAEVVDATEAFHLYTVAYNHATEVYTLFVDATEAASFTGARTFTTNGYQIGAVHGGAASVGLAVANGFVLDDFAVWKDFAAEEAHVKKIVAKYTPVIAVGSYAFDWPEGETTWRNDIGFTVGSATGIKPCAGDTIRFATGETITFASGAVIPSGLELIIDSGTVKLASGTPSKVTVNAGATLDVAGTPDREFAIVLNGGTLTNSGSNIGVSKKQTSAIELTADSLIDSEHDFGSVGGGWGRITCKLNGHTLTKRGAGTFVFANTSFSGGGTINVEKGVVELDKGYVFPSGSTLNITGSTEGVFSIAQTGTQSGTVNLLGNPTVRLKITSIPNFVKNATGWTGKLLIAANISGLTSFGANTSLYGNASEIEIASGASCSGYFPKSARTSKLTINGTFTVNDGYSGENQSATVSELAGSGTIVDGIAANSKSATPIIKVEKYANWNGTIQEATNKKLTIEFLQPTLPGVEGDDDVEVAGDAETGFVVKPSEGMTEVVITIPEGVDAEKVTIEVSTAVQSVKANGATIKVVKGSVDITSFLNIPAAVDGVVNLGAAIVKPEIVKEAMDPAKGAVFELGSAAGETHCGTEVTLTTAPTKPGLTYTLVEGVTLGAMADGDSTLGDGSTWTPDIKVKGGASAFYSIKVTK